MRAGPDEIGRFMRAIEAGLGVRLADRAHGLDELIARRAASHHESPASYLRRVESADREELRALATEVSVGETYFFRHVEQFNAFADLLPGLVAARGSLHVLSAGCSSGEEPYTLAMIARERLPDPRAVAVHAIDVNPAAIARARRGYYTRWALRATTPEHEQRWFAGEGRGVVIAKSIRDAVKFAEVNLVDDRALAALPNFDVVFCRNVLMYFNEATMRSAVERLAGTLVPGGYLFLGHAETLRDHPHGLELCHTHGTFYYRRVGGAGSPVSVAVASATPAVRAVPDGGWVGDIAAATERVRTMVDSALVRSATPAPVDGVVVEAPFDAIRALICDERFADAQDALVRLPAALADGPDAQLLHAIVYAQTGDVAACRRLGEALLAAGAHRAGVHYLLSICDGEPSSAEQHAAAALAEDPTFAMASVQLAFLARRRGDRVASTDHFGRAITLLEHEDPARLALFAGGFGRTAVIELCKSELRGGRSGAMTRERADELREAFDRGFAQPPAGPAPAYTDLLRIRVGGAPYALPVTDIASLHVDLRIEPVPSAAPALLGVATIRSQIVPVHDLRALLGITGGGALRWVVLTRVAVAVAFDSFDGLARLVAGTVDKGYPVLDLARVLRKEA